MSVVTSLVTYPFGDLLDDFVPLQVGGVCGLAVDTSNSGSGGPGFKPRPRVVFLDKELYSTLSLFT